jgi:hypothetical protein
VLYHCTILSVIQEHRLNQLTLPLNIDLDIDIDKIAIDKEANYKLMLRTRVEAHLTGAAQQRVFRPICPCAAPVRC